MRYFWCVCVMFFSLFGESKTLWYPITARRGGTRRRGGWEHYENTIILATWENQERALSQRSKRFFTIPVYKRATHKVQYRRFVFAAIQALDHYVIIAFPWWQHHRGYECRPRVSSLLHLLLSMQQHESHPKYNAIAVSNKWISLWLFSPQYDNIWVTYNNIDNYFPERHFCNHTCKLPSDQRWKWYQ